MKKITLLFLLLPLGIFAQSLHSAKDSSLVKADPETVIRANIRAFSEALVKQDYETVINSYTSDGKIFPNNRSILGGEEALRQYWIPQAGSQYRITYHKSTPEEIKVLGDHAYDYGYYEGRSIGNDGQESSWRGKYVIIWREVAPGDWKMYLDIWNRAPE
jgi:ketosteroid isomerase-like protein